MPKPSVSTNDSFATRILLINLSASCSETCTFPIDFIKTRMQATTSQKPFENVIKSIRRDGFLSIYRGLLPALGRHWIYTGARISLYEKFRVAGENYGFFGKMVSGLAAGGIGQFIANPMDVLKVRAITAARKGRHQSLISQFRSLAIERQLFRGVSPNVQRAMLVNLGELATYDISKQMILKHTSLEDNIYCHVSASIISGFFSSVLSCPADVVKTRMMMDSVKHQYTSTLNCAMHTIQTEGFMAMYRGFFPTWLRLAPWQLIFWTSYEHLRKISGLSGF